VYRLQSPPANEKQEPVPEEMSQTLLTNTKQEKTTKYTPLTLPSQPSFVFTGRNKFISMENQKSPLKI
jgi:hypothetical protein